MAENQDALYDRLVKVGLQDPFIRAVAGMVVIAVAASFAISALGSGTKSVITLALALTFGVVVVLRTLMKYIDSVFVKIVCLASCGVIMSVFLIFAIFLVPAAFICWPHGYAQLLDLQSCQVPPRRRGIQACRLYRAGDCLKRRQSEISCYGLLSARPQIGCRAHRRRSALGRLSQRWQPVDSQ